MSEEAMDSCPADWLTVPEAARFLKTSDKTVRRLVSAKKLGHYRVASKILFKRDQLATYVERNRVDARNEQ